MPRPAVKPSPIKRCIDCKKVLEIFNSDWEWSRRCSSCVRLARKNAEKKGKSMARNWGKRIVSIKEQRKLIEKVSQ